MSVQQWRGLGSRSLGLGQIGQRPLAYYTPVISGCVGRKDLGKDVSFAPVSQFEVLQQRVHVRQLVKHQVWNEPAMAIWRSVSDVPAHQRRVLVHLGSVNVELIVEIGVCPETLQLATRCIGQIREHADENERIVVSGRRSWGRNAPVQLEWGVVQLGVEAGVIWSYRFGGIGAW